MQLVRLSLRVDWKADGGLGLCPVHEEDDEEEHERDQDEPGDDGEQQRY